MHEIVASRVEDSIWKSRKQGATNTCDDFRIEQGSLLKTFELQFNGKQELFAKARAVRFIPFVRIPNLTQRAGGKLQAERHAPLRRCALTCSHE